MANVRLFFIMLLMLVAAAQIDREEIFWISKTLLLSYTLPCTPRERLHMGFHFCSFLDVEPAFGVILVWLWKHVLVVASIKGRGCDNRLKVARKVSRGAE